MSRLKLLGVLIVVAFFCYFSSLSAPFLWDDTDFIQNNVYVQHFDIVKIFTKSTAAGAGVPSSYYRPLTSLSFAIDAKIWGGNSFGFHLTNLFLHISAGVLLFLFLLELGIGSYVSFFVALIFLVHPLQVEAVTYSNSRGDSLYAALFFLSLLFFIKAIKQKAATVTLYKKQITISSHILLILSGIAYFLSILGKEVAIAGFLIYAPFYFVFTGKISRKVPKKILLFCISTLGIALLYLASRITFLNFSNTFSSYANSTVYSTNVFVRFFVFCKSWILYITWILFPVNLHFERAYDHTWHVASNFSQWFLIGFCLFIFFSILGWYYYKYKKTLLPLFGLFWMMVFLGPVSGIIPINGIIYQHWLYVPLIGFVLMVVSIVIPVWRKYFSVTLLFSLGMVVGGIFCILTIQQNNIWSDPVSFYQYNLQFTPNSERLHDNLAYEYEKKGNLQAAITEHHKAATLLPSVLYYNNAAKDEVTLRDFVGAEKDYLKILSLYPSDSNKLAVYADLVRLYLQSKQYQKGLTILEKLQPQMENNAAFERDYGMFLWLSGNKKEADRHFSAALSLSNNDSTTDNIINLIKSGKFPQ